MMHIIMLVVQDLELHLRHIGARVLLLKRRHLYQHAVAYKYIEAFACESELHLVYVSLCYRFRNEHLSRFLHSLDPVIRLWVDN